MTPPFKSCLRLLLVLTCATAAFLAGNTVQAASEREQRAFDAAASAFRDGFFERSEDEFAEFAKKYSKSELRANAILLQAQSRYKLTDSTGTVELLMSNLDRAGPLAGEYLFWAAEAYFQDRNYPAASVHYAKLVALYPDSSRNIESIAGEALACSRLGQSQRVIELLNKPDGFFAQAVRTKPANEFVVRGLLLLGETQLARGNFTTAESAIAPLAGQELNPALDWQVQQLRCRILLAQDRAQEAWQVSTNLPALAAASTGSESQRIAESIAFQAHILERLDRLDDAVAVLQQNLEEGAPAERKREALLKIAELSLTLDRVPEARQTLNRFLVVHTNSPQTDMVFLALGELDMKQHAAAVPMSGTISTNSTVTNRLQRAAETFDKLLEQFPRSSLAGRALLDKGWCLWLGGDVTNSLLLFKSATERLSFSEEQAVARFKWADAQMASGNFAGALTNYNFLIRNYATLASVKTKLFEPALYLAARAALHTNDMDAASDAVAKILDWFPNGFAGDRSLLLAGQGFLERKDAVRARELFDDFVKRWPESPLLPQVRLAVARSHEQEGDWLSAVGRYDEWIMLFPGDPARPRAEFHRAWANFQAGRETNAFTLFTNFTVRFPTNDLAPAAQWWVADFFFRQGDFEGAEKNYKLLFQTWPASSLAYEARMMAGRAALGRPDHSAAISHFTNLTSRLDCPPKLRVQALFAYGSTLMLMNTGDATNSFANYDQAKDVFNTICRENPTNEWASLAWGEIGNCYLQMGTKDPQFYDAATNAYQRAIGLPAATVTARSQAQVGIGLAIEKAAALRPADKRQGLLNAALSNYLDVVYEKNLRDGEMADLFWVKKAGLEAGRLIESLQDWDQAMNLYRRLQTLMPPLRDSLEKKIARAKEQLDSVKN